MKKPMTLVMLFVVFGSIVNAQCDKKTRWTSAKTIFPDSTLKEVKTDVETVIMELGKDNIKLIPHGSDEEIMTGTIYNKICNWPEAVKMGRRFLRQNCRQKGRYKACNSNH